MRSRSEVKRDNTLVVIDNDLVESREDEDDSNTMSALVSPTLNYFVE
jgi:hypothetical protein